MDKISIYELFSYLIPGYLFLYLCNYILNIVPINELNSLSTNIISIVLGFIIGVVVHSIIDKLRPENWFKDLIYEHPSQIYKNDPYLNPENKKVLLEWYKKTYNSEYSGADGDYPVNLFDHAYYYLEANDSIGPVKNLHSLYYMLRNTSFIMVIFIISMVILKMTGTSLPKESVIIIILILSTFGCIFSARFIRRKYIGKAIKIYFNHVVYKNFEQIKNNNNGK